MIDSPNPSSPDEPETEASPPGQATRRPPRKAAMSKSQPAEAETAGTPTTEQVSATESESPASEAVEASSADGAGVGPSTASQAPASRDQPSAPDAADDQRSQQGVPATPPRGAHVRAKRSRALVGFVAGGLVVAVLCALAIRQYVNGAQREVASELPSVAAEGDRVTAIAWAPYEGGPLFLGTAHGRMYRKSGTSVAEAFPPSRSTRDGEPIVAIHPDQVRQATANAEWVALDPRASADSAAYRTTEGVHARNGLATIYGGRLLAVVEGDQQPAAAVSKKAPAPVRSDTRGMIDERFDSDLVSAIAMATIRGGALTRAIQSPATDRGSDRLVLGYTDGTIRLFDASARRTFNVTFADAARDASAGVDRSIIALATPFDQARDRVGRTDVRVSNVLFASASVAGEVRVYRGESGDGPISTQTLLRPGGQTTPLVRPVQDGLFVSTDGRILMLYGPHGLTLANLDDSQTPVRSALYRPADLVRKPQTRDDTGLRISAAALSSQGDVFAIAVNDGTIRIVTVPASLQDLSQAEFFTIHGHSDVIVRVAISSNGSELASLGADGRVWVTDITRARQLSLWPFRDLRSGPRTPEMQAVALQMPQPAPPSRRLPQLIVAFGADDSAEAAQAELGRARAAGFTDLGIYRWGNKYNSVARFPDEASQLDGLTRLRGLSRWSRDAYKGLLSSWCPFSTTDDVGVIVCNSGTATVR